MKSLEKLKKQMAKNISPDAFFKSDVLKNYAKRLINIVSKRFDTPLSADLAFEPNSQATAYTNNKKVYINLASEEMQKFSDIESRYKEFVGLLAHELGHVLFTDFDSTKIFTKNLEDGHLWPIDFSDIKMHSQYGQDAVSTFYADVQQKKVSEKIMMRIFANVSNIFEDGYVERRMSETFPGSFKQCIAFVRDDWCKNADDGVPEQIDILSDTLNGLFSFVFNDCSVSERVKNSDCFKAISSEFSHYGLTNSSLERNKLYSAAVVCLYPTIKKMIDEKRQQNQQQQNQQGEGEVQPGENGQNGEATQMRCGGQGSNSKSQNGGSQKESKSQQKEDNKSSSGDKDSSNGESNDDANKSIEDALNNTNQSSQRGSGMSALSDISENGEGDESSDQEESESDPLAGDKTSGVEGGHDCIRDEPLISALELLEAIVDEKIKREPIAIRQAQDESDVTSIQETNAHFGVSCKIENPIERSSNRAVYDKVFNDTNLKNISKVLQRKLLEILEEKREGTTCSGLLMGNRISTMDIAHNDGRIFKRNMLPDEYPELAVSLLIDESGSMSGTRIAAAMKMAMLVEDFTRGLQIPLAVTGHYNSGGVHLTPYIRFDEPVSQNNKYRLSSMSAGGCNRDGFALRYCVKKLEEQDAASKIMIIISDGQPNAECYGGATAKQDLQEVKKECERNGITLIAAAIGEDKDVIQNIYGNSFLDISDISELPKKIINLLKKQLI